MQVRDRIVVVTGAASGIGARLAHRFAKEGAKLVVCSDLQRRGRCGQSPRRRAASRSRPMSARKPTSST